MKKQLRWVRRVSCRGAVSYDAADTLEALMMLPSNRFKALSGNRRGQYSIRINSQWRICFEWGSAGPEKVEIVDYH
jgi:proteic killer suppression protein